MLKKAISLVMCGTMLFGCGCSSSKTDTASATADNTKVNVFIAASLSNAMNEIAENYKKKDENVELVFNADSSGTLKTQITEGASCDIFFSAAEKQMNELKDGGYIEDGSVVPLLENKVVLIKGKGAETSVTGFDNITSAKNIALAGEDVPVGSYSREIFTNMGILDDVMSKDVNECANVTAVLTAVAEGSNEVGVVYATDAASMADKVEVIAEAPADALKTPVVYPVGLVKNNEASDEEKKDAKEFVDYLQTDDAKAVFTKYGFSVE